jgi:hypothetical protein
MSALQQSEGILHVWIDWKHVTMMNVGQHKGGARDGLQGRRVRR